MVYINDVYRFIFIENPKSGSTAILSALSRSLGIQPIQRDLKKQNAHLTCKEVKELVGLERWNSYYKVSTYRDPLKRFLSSANYPRHSMLRGFRTFDEYQTHLNDVLSGKSKCQYCIPQSEYLDVDFLIHTDTIQEGYDTVCNKIGIPSVDIKQINKNSTKLFDTERLTEIYNQIDFK